MYQILNEDCLEALIRMDDGIADLCLIDPPYFDYKTGHRKDKEGKLSQSLVQQSREDQLRTVQECIRVLKEDRAFFLFTNWEQSWWMMQRLQSHIRNMIIWDKKNWSAGDLKGSFGNQYEVILLGTKGKNWTYTGKRESDIWSIPRMGTNRIHSTEKPIDLYVKIIENATKKGDFIIDPYLGSGVSIIAAASLERNIMGFEIDKEYYQRILERVYNWERR